MTRTEIAAAIDAYLVGENPDRASLFTKIAGWQPDLEAAAPIVRAIGLVGPKAADESLIALRLILNGQAASDERVVAVRTLTKKIATGDTGARSEYRALVAQRA